MLVEKVTAPQYGSGYKVQLTLSPREVELMKFCLGAGCAAASQSGGVGEQVRALAVDFKPATEWEL